MEEGGGGGRGGAEGLPEVELPAEVWAHVFRFLRSPRDRAAVTCSCRAWAEGLAWRECDTLDLQPYVAAINGSSSCFLFGDKGLINKCTRVRDLNLRKAPVNNPLIERVLMKWPTLQRLNLSCVLRLNGTTLELIGKHLGPRLTHLNLASCRRLRDEAFTQMCAACPNIESLRIRGCFMLTDASLRCIALYLKNLKLLNIQGLQRLTDVGFNSLSESCTRLRDLDMQSCSPTLTRKTFKKIAKRVTGLESLILKFCPPVDDSVLRVMGSSLGSTLEVIELQGCLPDQISDAGVIPLVSGCTRLRRLNVNGLKLLTDATLGAIAKHLRQLVELELKECFMITDKGLHYLAAGNTHMLETFNIEFCSNITDEGIAALCGLAARRKTEQCGAPVRILNLGHLPHLTSRSLELIARHVGDDLHSLNISQCGLVDEDAVLDVLRSCQHLRVINVKYLPQLSDRFLENVMAHDCYALEKLLITNDSFSPACLSRIVQTKRRNLVLNVAAAMSTLPAPASEMEV